MKYAIVTGGSSGIGFGVANMLVEKGYYVVATYANNEPQSNISNLEFFRMDQSSKKEVYHFIAYIKSRFVNLNCLVCNAGVVVRKSFVDISDEDWTRMMDVALNSHFILIREFFDMLLPNSRILFTGSLMGEVPHATVLGYGVVKAAVHALAKNLVKEFEGTGTTVNVVVPGFVDTPWQEKKPKEIRDNICKKTALHRFATIDEVVKAFLFCLENPYVNGSLIDINGGYDFR